MSRPNVPVADTQEYLWWSQGARDEQEARDEGLTHEVKDLIYVIGQLARQAVPAQNAEQALKTAARIYAPHLLRRRYRS